MPVLPRPAQFCKLLVMLITQSPVVDRKGLAPPVELSLVGSKGRAVRCYGNRSLEVVRHRGVAPRSLRRQRSVLLLNQCRMSCTLRSASCLPATRVAMGPMGNNRRSRAKEPS